jgi:pimeloyl-ACP methyl ester carboxylesterase
MPYATLDGIKTHYLKQGSGPVLLMMAPRGFNSCIESWSVNKWKEMDSINALSSHFTCIAYDRREAGLSGGRVEPLTWDVYARHGKLLLEHLGVDKAWVIGPCMGVAVATKFAALYPEACIALMLPQPVGGYHWMAKMRGLFDAHIDFVIDSGLEAVVEHAKKEGRNFQDDGKAGPWGTVIAHDAAFAARYVKQDIERYLEIVADSRDAMFPDTFVNGARPEELMAITTPAFCWAGDDPAHATSAGHQVRELMPHLRLWDLHPSKHTGANMLEQLVRFKQDVESGAFPAKR